MRLFFYTFCLTFLNIGFAQKPLTPTPSDIYFRMEQLNVLASALYIAAHPDDENTRLITYLTHHDKAHTSYLSLTRGNGGQNLISNELGDDLGVIRTNELWNARKIDGGQQFFSTADDFGYSKNPTEAFEKWNKENLMQQMVYMIRKEQPDIIINRFDHRTEGTTHGHHTASALLSKEAFTLAQDTSYTIEKDQSLPLWQPKRLFFNVSWFFFGSKQAFEKADKSNYIPIDIGVFYKQLGKNNQEIASLSRSQHQSQGFGDLSSRGEEIDYVELIDGASLQSSNLFEGIDTSWNRIEGGHKIQPLVNQLLNEFDFKHTDKSIRLLTKIYTEIEKLPESVWKQRKQNEVKELIKDCAGLFLDLTTNQPLTTPHETVSINVEVANRALQNIVVKDITLNDKKHLIEKSLGNQDVLHKKIEVSFTENDYTNFKFIETFDDFKNQFTPNHKHHIGIEINGVYVLFPVKIQYRYKDEVKGEVYKPFHVVPKVSVRYNQSVYVSSPNTKQTLPIILDNYSEEEIRGELSIFNVDSMSSFIKNLDTEVSLDKKQRNKKIFLTNNFPNQKYSISLKTDQFIALQEIKWVDYDHIPLSYYFKEPEIKLISLDKSKLKKQRIGYIMGAGDEIPQILENIGYQVDLIDLKAITKEDLSAYETIVVGIRAFNTEDELRTKNKWLFEYTKNGGTVIVQYQTSMNLRTDKIAPFQLELGRTRITDENATVNFINPNMKVLNQPFLISERNFKNWVQEQGLYYADSFAKAFQPVFSSQDFDKKPTKGGLLIATYGKGYYIYTGLSFFRQLPAGNVGALELFINLIELQND